MNRIEFYNFNHVLRETFFYVNDQEEGEIRCYSMNNVEVPYDPSLSNQLSTIATYKRMFYDNIDLKVSSKYDFANKLKAMPEFIEECTIEGEHVVAKVRNIEPLLYFKVNDLLPNVKSVRLHCMIPKHVIKHILYNLKTKLA